MLTMQTSTRMIPSNKRLQSTRRPISNFLLHCSLFRSLNRWSWVQRQSCSLLLKNKTTGTTNLRVLQDSPVKYIVELIACTQEEVTEQSLQVRVVWLVLEPQRSAIMKIRHEF
nr:hypothetical protein Iba_scaffold21028CG0010 [Ipomoea batatas]